MKNLRNKNHPPNADLVQVHFQTSYDIVKAVYDALPLLEALGAAIDAGQIQDFLTESDIDTLAELNALVTDATFGTFASEAEALAGSSNDTTMTPLRVAQAIAFLSSNVQSNFTALVDPTEFDDESLGYAPGSTWINRASVPPEAFRCADATFQTAIWVKTTLTTDELALVALSGSSDDLLQGVTKLLMTVAERAKLALIEDAATQDQTDAEIETGYNNQVSVVNQATAEAGISTTVFRWTPERVAQAIASLASTTGRISSRYYVTANDGAVLASGTLNYINAIGGAFTVKLPASPDNGDIVIIAEDGGAGVGEYSTIDRNGKTIDGAATNDAILFNGSLKIFGWDGINTTWRKWGSEQLPDTVETPGLLPSVQTGNYTILTSEDVGVNSLGGAFNITLKASPVTNDVAIIHDIASNCGVTPVPILRNGSTINGAAADVSLNFNDAIYWFMYTGTTWRFTALKALTQAQVDARVIEIAGNKYIGQNLQTGTSYQLVLGDAGKLIEMNNAGVNTLTIPANAAVPFPVNTFIDVIQYGAGQTTIAITSDTLRGAAKISAQYKAVSLWKRAATEWIVIGGVA